MVCSPRLSTLTSDSIFLGDVQRIVGFDENDNFFPTSYATLLR